MKAAPDSSFPRIVPPTPETLRRAADLLLAGTLVVRPTETVYGLACRPDSPDAIDRLYAAKNRPPRKPITALAPSLDAILPVLPPLPPVARRIADRYWPGPLTLVLPSLVPGRYDGFRVPDHPVALALLRLLPFAPLVTSANLSGQPPALTAAEAAAALPSVPLILDDGPSPGATPSTVLRIASDGTLSLLRPGPISLEALQALA